MANLKKQVQALEDQVQSRTEEMKLMEEEAELLRQQQSILTDKNGDLRQALEAKQIEEEGVRERQRRQAEEEQRRIVEAPAGNLYPRRKHASKRS